jgi:hypothetical protein
VCLSPERGKLYLLIIIILLLKAIFEKGWRGRGRGREKRSGKRGKSRTNMINLL